MEQKLMDNQLNREVLSLLAVSSLSDLEKQVWLTILPHMTDDEKCKLKANLEKQVALDGKITEEKAEQFISTFDKLTQK